ncbi:hypothetical protein QBC44DRAFT_364098 [Cladorrhinum sp. PSN332]|nr:hypothetical protein QBC44DRAFT_364098 [Cladorrhinum sp. PSN332]
MANAGVNTQNNTTWDTLAHNNISFQRHPKHVMTKGLPPHVEYLRRSLLDFDCTIPDKLSFSDMAHFNTPISFQRSFEEVQIPNSQKGLIKEYLKHCRGIREDALILHKRKAREAEWQKFFDKKFFDPLAEQVKVTDQDPRRTARAKFYYDHFETAQDRPWSLFGKHQFKAAQRLNLTEPKPDLAFFYPIYDFESGCAIPTPEAWKWGKTPKHNIVDNFSRPVLQHLAKHGLQPSTTSSIEGTCFPWFIVEHKMQVVGKEKEYCYCQAANAGAAAVMMLQQLARPVHLPAANAADSQVPPVITMTTVDKVVRVWATYCCNGSSLTKFQMDCIWKGDMTEVRDICNLHAILENAHTWAMRELRPCISSHVDQWRAQFPMNQRPSSRQYSEEREESSLVSNSASQNDLLENLLRSSSQESLYQPPEDRDSLAESLLRSSPQVTVYREPENSDSSASSTRNNTPRPRSQASPSSYSP